MGITYYVSIENGADSNSGTTESQPFKTIQRAADIAIAGDTILVAPGIYRERVSPVCGGTSTAPITYRSTEVHGAVIRGSIIWLPTNKCGENIYVGELNENYFTDNSAIDGGNPFKIPMCVTPYGRNGAPEAQNKDANSDAGMIYTLGQVFVNDRMATQCPYKNEMEKTENSWYYDVATNQLYVNTNMEEPVIEITNQRRLFAPHIRGCKYIIVDGFIIERCGNQYPNKFWTIPQNQQAGAIGTRCGKYWTIQNNIIRYANGIGIDWGNEGGIDQDLEIGQNGKAQGANGHIIRNNIIADNGAAGTASYMCKNFMFVNNVVERNNNLRFWGKRRWESAGVKVHGPSSSIISQNIIRNNYCHGIWSDQGAGVNSIFKNNIIVGNQQSGINFEIGSQTSGKVLNNIFDKNEYGVSLVTSGGVLIAHNLFLCSTIADIYTNIFTRTADKWDSLNLEIYYNMFLKSPQYLQLTVPSEGVASRYMNYNEYREKSSQQKFQLISMDGKTKTNMNYETWKTTWTNYNMGKNGDEGSYSSTMDVDVCLKELENKSYQCTINMIPFMFPYISRTDIKDDYFMTVWEVEAKTCISGPFVDISKGIITL